MDYLETLEHADKVAQEALSCMRRLGIPSHPRNFAIWYGFFSEKFPDLSRRVQSLLENKVVFTEAVNDDLFERFFTSRHEAEGMLVATRRLDLTLAQMRSLFLAAHQGTEAYGDALETFGRRLLETDSGMVEVLVSAALDETRAMLDINRTLGEELTRSSAEVRQLREELERVRREALTDGLTGLGNRKVFDAGVRDLTQRATAEATRGLSLMMLDIDHFKTFNDCYGHQMGDQVLRLVASMIQDSLEGEAITARYGGEEFAVLLPDTPGSEAVVVAERIRRHVASRHVTNRRTGQDLGGITLSAGVSQYILGEAAADFIRRADEALYAAKAQGRNCVVCFEDEAGLPRRRLAP
ncbi:GGDEF domain-containing protein [Pararhodospirillum photometricum]|nr:GGDEF domain-containing protein [Pararhodospirillum photometricum]